MVNWVAIGEVAVGGGVVGVVAVSQWMHSGIKICNFLLLIVQLVLQFVYTFNVSLPVSAGLIPSQTEMEVPSWA